jgi:hypothetical protein
VQRQMERQRASLDARGCVRPGLITVAWATRP